MSTVKSFTKIFLKLKHVTKESQTIECWATIAGTCREKLTPPIDAKQEAKNIFNKCMVSYACQINKLIVLQCLMGMQIDYMYWWDKMF